MLSVYNIYCTPDLTQSCDKTWTQERGREKNLKRQCCFSRRLCAPIASLDCMEEFSGNTGLDLRKNSKYKRNLVSLIFVLMQIRTISQPWIKDIAQECFIDARWLASTFTVDSRISIAISIQFEKRIALQEHRQEWSSCFKRRFGNLVCLCERHHRRAGRDDYQTSLREWNKSLRFIGPSFRTPRWDRDGKCFKENELEADDLCCDSENLLEHKVNYYDVEI